MYDDDFGDYDCYERDDDYNVFEENQLDLDRWHGEYDEWEDYSMNNEALQIMADAQLGS